MTDPKHAITVGVQSIGTALSEGEFAKVTNLTSGGTLRGSADSNGEVILTPEPDFEFTWKNTDVCSVEISGRLLLSKSAIISKGGIRIKLNASADTSSPGVDL